MKVAVIGAGNVGRALTHAIRAAGHDVTISANDTAHARDAAAETGATAAASNTEAVDGADIVALAVPYPAVGTVGAEIADSFHGIVIDATNPINEDFSGLSVTARSGGQEVQDQLPRATVVKAFNTVFAGHQARPEVDGVALDGFYAGDDPTSKATVAGLLADIGYRPVDAGSLADALQLEHMAFLNIALNARNGWSWQTGWKLAGPLS